MLYERGRGEVTLLRRKGVFRIAVCAVFVCLFISALTYQRIFASHRDKIHFLMSPKATARFIPPVDTPS